MSKTAITDPKTGPKTSPKTSPKTTFVSFLLDETGSMESIKDDTLAGLDTYLEQLRGTGDEILFSLVSFNSSRTRKRCVAEPIARVRPLTAEDYAPEAMTPLIDASVKIIHATAEAVLKRGDDPAVVIVIQTDGLENCSVEYGAADLAVLVKQKEQAGWQFVFLGAGLDAFAAAREAGLRIDPLRVVSYDRAHSREVFAASALNVAEYAASHDVARLSFSDQQRDQVGDRFTRRHLGSGVKSAPAKSGTPLSGRSGTPSSGNGGSTSTKSGTARSRKGGETPSSVDDFAL